MKSLAAALTATVLMVVGATLGVAAPASAAPYLDGADPVASGCAQNASTLWSASKYGYGTVELRYSWTCGTKWVRITKDWGIRGYGAVDGGRGMQVKAFGDYDRQVWTPMVYSPFGRNSVIVGASLRNCCGVVWSWNRLVTDK
jgi:hypothetical protein